MGHSGQRRSKVSVNGASRTAASNHNGFSNSSNKVSTYTPSLNLYSNYLMSQQASAFSPAASAFNHSAKTSNNPSIVQGLLVATSTGQQPSNVSVRVKKYKQQTTGSRPLQLEHPDAGT